MNTENKKVDGYIPDDVEAGFIDGSFCGIGSCRPTSNGLFGRFKPALIQEIK